MRKIKIKCVIYPKGKMILKKKIIQKMMKKIERKIYFSLLFKNILFALWPTWAYEKKHPKNLNK